jgi:hypothetical protein
MSIIANTVIIGKRSKNSSSITATTVTVASGGINAATGSISAQNVTIASGGKNMGGVTVTGAVILDGGTNTSSATITGNLTINSGNSAAAVTGDVRMSGGTNTGNITGNLYVLSSSATNTAATVTGNIVLASSVNAASVVPAAYTGNVIQVVSGALKTTGYMSGTAGTPTTAPDGTYYNLEGDSKAYSYTSGVPELFGGTAYNLQGDSKAYAYTAGVGGLFTGSAYNLTGDSKAYSWTAGVRGSLFTGTLNGVSFVDGLAQGGGSTYKEYDVTFEASTGKLYTNNNDDILTGTVYSDDILSMPFTGVFQYSSTWYYADAGVVNLYRAWAVGNDTNAGVLYTAAADNLVTGTVRTNTALDTSYTGVYSYDNVNYAVNNGADYTGAVEFSSEWFTASNRVISTDKATGVSQPLGSSLYYNFFGDGTGSLFDGAVQIENNYIAVVAGVLGDPQADFADGVQLLAGDSKYYTFSSSTPSAATIADGNIYIGALNRFYVIDNGVRGNLFTGVFKIIDQEIYRDVIEGVTQETATAGIRIFADDNLYYNFPGDQSKPANPFNGAIQVGDYWYSVTAGVREATPTFNGVMRGGGANAFYRVDNGVNTGMTPYGIHMFAYDSLYYNYSAPTVSTLVSAGAVQIGSSWYSITEGVREATPTFTGVAFFVHPVTNSSGYWYITNGVFADSNIPNVRMLASNGLYYSFPGNGTLPTSVFNGAFMIEGSWYSVVDGVKEGTATFNGARYDESQDKYFSVTNGLSDNTINYASGALMLASDGLYYSFPGNGNLGTLLDGAVQIGSSWYSVTEGVREATATFTGAYFDGAFSYWNIDGGQAYQQNASGVRKLANDGKYYTFPGNGSAGVLFTGILSTNPVINNSFSGAHVGYMDGVEHISQGYAWTQQTSCDDNSQNVVFLSEQNQININDKMIKIGYLANTTFIPEGEKTGSVYFGDYLYHISDGVIASSSPCDPYNAD